MRNTGTSSTTDSNLFGLIFVGNHLSDAGYAPGVSEELADYFSATGWMVFKTSVHKNRLLRLLDMLSSIWRYRRQIDAGLVDVYSGNAFVWAECSTYLLRFMGKPVVLTLHGGNLPVFAARWPWRVRRLLNMAHTVTTPSVYLFEEMRQFRSDLTVIPNPVPVANYRFRLRSALRPILVWLRAFHSIYNPSLVPKVVAELIEDFPEIFVYLVGPDKGDGSYQATVEIAEKLSVLERMEFPGLVPKGEVPEWLDKADVFLNTASVDNTPISVLEALSCGLCVVSTRAGGIPYLLEDGVDALLVPADDPQAMACAVRRLLKDQRLAESVSSNARKKAEGFDSAALYLRWDVLIREVIVSRLGSL